MTAVASIAKSVGNDLETTDRLANKRLVAFERLVFLGGSCWTRVFIGLNELKLEVSLLPTKTMSCSTAII